MMLFRILSRVTRSFKSKTKRFLSSENSAPNKKKNNNKPICTLTIRYAVLNIENDEINNMETNKTIPETNLIKNSSIRDTDQIKTNPPPSIFVRALLVFAAFLTN